MGLLKLKRLSNTSDSMATILIDPFPATGHYNGSLSLAKILKERGHTLIYTGPPEYREKINSEGHQFLPSNTLLLGITKDIFWRYWFDSFVSLFNNTCLKEFLKVTEQYDALIEKLKPDLILLDVLQLQKIVVYGKHKINVIGFDTRVAASYAPNVPPYSSSYVPRKNVFSKKYVDWLWFKYDIQKLVKIFFLKIRYFGNDVNSMYRKLGKINRVDLEKWKDVQRICPLKIVPQNLFEIILTPACFDFPRPSSENMIYIDPCLEKRDALVLSERYLYVRDSILELKRNHPAMKFIYVSIGTVSGSTPKREMRFIKVLMEYCSKNKDHRIVFSIGKHFDISILKSIPDSLYIFNHLPQLDILKYCDFMITHGGTNSLIECIMNEVPVIVYPLLVGKPNWDQNGNSARVVYHQIGIRGKINTMTSSSLRKKVDEMCRNYAFYKLNIKSMNERLNPDKTANHAVARIETFLK